MAKNLSDFAPAPRVLPAFVHTRRAPWNHWYNLQRWRKRRNAQLRDHPLCAMHLAKGEAVAASVADHITAHKGDWQAFIAGPLQSLCGPCHHSTKRMVELHGYVKDVGEDGWPLDPAHPVYGKASP